MTLTVIDKRHRAIEMKALSPDLPVGVIARVLAMKPQEVMATLETPEGKRALARKGNYKKELQACVAVAVAQSVVLLTKTVIAAQMEVDKKTPNQSILSNGVKAATALLHGTGVLQVHQVISTDAPDARALLEAMVKAENIRNTLRDKALSALSTANALPAQTGEHEGPPGGGEGPGEGWEGGGEFPSPKIPPNSGPRDSPPDSTDSSPGPASLPQGETSPPDPLVE